MPHAKTTPRQDSTATIGFEAGLWLALLTALVLAPAASLRAADKPPELATIAEGLVLNYHLMHPGGDSLPGDPNAAFCLDGTYHLHYILAHPWNGQGSFSFVHVTSPDMLHWTWQPTKLQPSFTGHGMFSGTGFITKEGKPAAIYHGQGSGKEPDRHRHRSASSQHGQKPYPIEVRNADGTEALISATGTRIAFSSATLTTPSPVAKSHHC